MTLMQRFATKEGKPFPLGASVTDSGCNFSIHYAGKDKLSLSIFSPITQQLLFNYPLDPLKNRSGTLWHIELISIPDDYLYAFQLQNEKGFILDPYTKKLISSNQWDDKTKPYLPLSGIYTGTSIDWENTPFPRINQAELIIYEMHVRGFTQHVSSAVESPGTFLGMIQKIPFLQDLGINAVELLPVQEFNEKECHFINPTTKEPLCNYWGYSPVNFFSPMNRYASSNLPGSAIYEFQQMVKAFHQAGIEVILDVVFNHTFFSDEEEPHLSFQILDKKSYYYLDSQGVPLNFSGCGNTFRGNHPLAQDLIIEALRFWRSEMRIDGFRFDLTSILTLNQRLIPSLGAGLIVRIAEDPLLSEAKLIAEPWDAAGAYQLGQFADTFPQFCEWNDKYRDAFRRYIKGTPGSKEEFATRLCGSEDLFSSRAPTSSINFITAHDGFTLNDLVSYNQKDNWNNGEDNRDGNNNNISWNCGAEGAATSEAISLLRVRQRKNFHLALMTSQGIPMILMGDEYGHTKLGNNNTWCQDSSLNWFLWDELLHAAEFFRFYKGLIHFRKTHPLVRQEQFLANDRVEWHGVKPFDPKWQSPSLFLAFRLLDLQRDNDLYIAFNPKNSEETVETPLPREGKTWHFVADTSRLSPQDFWDPTNPIPLKESSIYMLPYSSLILKAL